MTTGTRKPGEFCWINMLTPKPAEARVFFAKLFGWTYTELAGMGHSIQVGGKNIGGLFDLEGPNTPPGTPPLIGVMVKVESADATAAKVVALGGKALPAFDIMDQGRMAVCFDPNGVNFDVWQAMKGPGMDADSEMHGVASWFETLTSDVDRAAEFYCALFGWTSQELPMPGGKYTVFESGGASVAGAMAVTPKMGDMHPQWKTYFTVKDADASVRAAIAMGATISMTMKDIPGGGRICGIVSPQGVPFSIAQYKP